MAGNTLLAGIRVLDLSRLLPGPFCSLYLAQMGAEVIKIEEPEGGDYARGMRELFAQVSAPPARSAICRLDCTGGPPALPIWSSTPASAR